MDFPRASGIILHPTSLPGPYGIGELGSAAYAFVDFLVQAGQRLWQLMPLGPTGYGDSPYASPSAFAGNPLLISLERLRDQGLLSEADLSQMPDFPADRVDFGAVIPCKMAMLRRSFARWQETAGPGEREAFAAFQNEHRAWLEDFALFMAIKDAHTSVAWVEWPAEYATRQPEALARARAELADEIRCHRYLQFQFFRQWRALREYANGHGVRMIGDVPIFVAADSADAWANPHLFYLDDRGRPTHVAGVPPDYFSPTGQRWGNPHYRWEAMSESGYAWWIDRFRQTFRLVDILRIDHFRGFEACWEVPASAETAVNGRWVKGPGLALFRAIEAALGDLPIIAEDLGFITPEVEAMRLAMGFPGMRVLQFAFDGGAANPFLPHNYVPETVVYTGTHDNDTTRGWHDSAPEQERAAFWRYTGQSGGSASWEMLRLALASVARMALFPLQDALGLGSEARMNIPGSDQGNWTWRYQGWHLREGLAADLAEMSRTYGR